MSGSAYLLRLFRERGALGFLSVAGRGARRYASAWRFVTGVALGLDWQRGLPRVLESSRPEHGILAMQREGEIRALLERAAALGPRTILEIGTASGGTLFLWTRVAAADARIVSVDLPEGPWGGGYRPWRSPLYRRFRRTGQSIVLIRGNSRSEEVRRAAARSLGGLPLDVLFIDGDHSYEGVRADFEAFAPWVRAGGLIALHDICPDASRPDLGVARFWRELKEDRITEEFVQDPGQASYGIGLLRPGRSACAWSGGSGP